VKTDATRIQAHAPLGLASTIVVRPRTVADACAFLADAAKAGTKAMLLAGGTDVIVDRHLMPVERAETVDMVIDVTSIDGFHGVDMIASATEERIRLAGGVTYWDLRHDAILTHLVPMLAVMAKDVGAVQIQTRGTLAGNIASASPAADGVPALMALDANVTLASASGTRTVPLDGFFTAYRKTVMRPDEMILDVDLRVPHRKALVKWRKVGTRLAQAISKVALASVIEVEGGKIKHARFGMASVAAVTHPLPSVRKYLEGRAVDAVVAADLDAAVAADIKPIDDVRSTGRYRLHVAKALVRRALEPAETA
jgi:xanthine dehydrogenase small subunit